MSADGTPVQAMAPTGPRRRRPTRRRTGYLYKPEGTVNWWYAIGYRGQNIRKSTMESDRKKAEKVLKAKRGELDAAEHGYTVVPGPEAERVTINQRLDALVADYTQRGVKSARSVTSHLKPVRAFFGALRVVDFTGDAAEQDVAQYIRQRLAAGVAPASVNRGLQLLGQAVRLFLTKHRLPMPEIPKLPEEDNVRQGFAELAECEAILTGLPDDGLRDFAAWAYWTAWRKGEVESLRWTDVEHDAQAIRLSWRASKNGEARRMALVSELGAIIERRWAARVVTMEDGSTRLSEYVFHRGDGQPVGDFRKVWRTACTAAGVPSRLFHDFRRSGVRNLIRAGVERGVAMKISGHRTEHVFERYNITDDKDIRQAMERVSAHMAQQPTAHTVRTLPKATERA
jgi:integrase